MAQETSLPNPSLKPSTKGWFPPLTEPAERASADAVPGSTAGAGSDVSAVVTPSSLALAEPTSPPPDTAAASQFGVQSSSPSIWERGVGEGFRPDTQSITVSGGGTYGIDAFGSRQRHHLAIGSVTYGHMLGHVVGEGHWWRGNPEFRLELFSGAQYDPGTRWLVGLTPHLRYNFATGTRWIPFVDAGAGVTATSIGPPDLSGTFEFNLQPGTGVQWFIKENLALSLEARYLHMSCAGIHDPNLGLNGVSGLLGIACFF